MTKAAHQCAVFVRCLLPCVCERARRGRRARRWGTNRGGTIESIAPRLVPLRLLHATVRCVVVRAGAGEQRAGRSAAAASETQQQGSRGESARLSLPASRASTSDRPSERRSPSVCSLCQPSAPLSASLLLSSCLCSPPSPVPARSWLAAACATCPARHLRLVRFLRRLQARPLRRTACTLRTQRPFLMRPCRSARIRNDSKWTNRRSEGTPQGTQEAKGERDAGRAIAIRLSLRLLTRLRVSSLSLLCAQFQKTAEEYIAEVPVIEVNGPTAICDGGHTPCDTMAADLRSCVCCIAWFACECASPHALHSTCACFRSLRCVLSGDPRLGHPIEFIQLNKVRPDEPSTCKYCGLRFIMAHGHHGGH